MFVVNHHNLFQSFSDKNNLIIYIILIAINFILFRYKFNTSMYIIMERYKQLIKVSVKMKQTKDFIL